ncbi:hypothetical protein F5884DRAFT_781309 [Xylogone sp. PMI_703]|nr:hypothetical protein F5884DRAFT_781309 [Xylogone sp. PMI_703]
MLQLIYCSELTLDAKRQHRINANSFQQNAILSYNGWQYVTYYSNESDQDKYGPLLVNISRRHLNTPSSSNWETITFQDYKQTVDDGHNTISLGICPGDGTIHVSFDHHCDQLRYRVSKEVIANEPTSDSWATSSFGEVLSGLPHCDSPQSIFSEVTYPRFISVGKDLLLSYRIGKAGSGSDVLFKYSSESHKYSYLGQFLTGVENSPYINGIDYAQGKIHVSGTYRHFIEYEGANDPSSTAHKANAGPNGPENNYNLFYAYSDDLGTTYRNSKGHIIASLDKGGSIYPNSEGLIVFDIPRNSGILNQESQAADPHGGFHVLNREMEKWIHYFRDKQGHWSKHFLPDPQPTNTGARGCVNASDSEFLFFALPGNRDDSLTIISSPIQSLIPSYEVVWKGDGFFGEPHLDLNRIGQKLVLSVFTGMKSLDGTRKVVVLDLSV